MDQFIDVERLAMILIMVVSFIPAMMFHEVAHGYMAWKLGDPTAKSRGRLSLNPLKHIDPFGTVLLPLMLILSGMPAFGYAKPVPYNPRYFKDIRKGEILTGFAGPAANLVLGLAGALLANLVVGFYDINPAVMSWVLTFFYVFTLVNFSLMFFNILPIPPLDGSSIIAPLLPRSALPRYYAIQRYTLPIFMVVIIVLPMLIGFNPIGIYMQYTAYGLTDLLFLAI